MGGGEKAMPDPSHALACQQLLARHADAQDCGGAEALADLFATDGQWVRPGREPIVGRDAILSHARLMYQAPLYKGRVVHMITNTLFSAVEDGLGSTSYCLAYGAAETLPGGVAVMAPPLSIARYINRFRMEAGEWKISFHRTEFLFTAPGIG